jgi:CRISPR/Cas system-associated exonuclease Cas4 (RecB family)
MAGERHCWYAPWFQARHSHIQDPRPRSTDLSQWTAEHGLMVQQRADQLRAEGWEVYLEDQNSFKLKGKQAILSGKIDILAIAPDRSRALVIDCKTGSEKDADLEQVVIYCYAAPKFHPAIRCTPGLIVTGEVQYRTQTKPIVPPPPAYVRLFDAMARIVGPEPPKAPSFAECRFCKLSKADCADRVDEDMQPQTEVQEF